MSHPPAHISNLHLKFGGIHKGAGINLATSKHRKTEQNVENTESKTSSEAPAGAGRVEWKILYKMLMSGLGCNRIGQKLLATVAGKVGYFDWSRDWVDSHSSIAAEVMH